MSEREPHAIFEDEQDERVLPAHRLRRNWSLHLGTLVLAVVVVLLGKASTWYAALGWFGGLIGLIITFLFVTRNAFPRAVRAELRVASKRAVLDGRSIAIEEIAEAKLIRQRRAGGDHVLEMRLRDGTTIALSMVHADAIELLRILEIGAGERRSTFRTVVPFGRRFIVALGALGLPWVVMTFATAEIDRQGVPVIAISMGAILAAIVAWLTGYLRGKLVIGAEGFTTRWLLWKRFVSFAEVQSIERSLRVRKQNDTQVVLRSGKSILLSSVEAPENEDQRGAEGEALLKHLEDAYKRWLHTRTTATAAPLLQRSGRTARDWLADLDRIVRAEGSGYRIATVNLEALVAIVRTPPDGAGDARIGAAAALVRIGVDEHRATVRIAAEACAEPKTRGTLLALASADSDHEVERILERASS